MLDRILREPARFDDAEHRVADPEPVDVVTDSFNRARDLATETAVKAELDVKLILHELVEAPTAPTFLLHTSSPAGKRVVEIALGDPQNRLSASETASRAATPLCSTSRLFPLETGLAFKAWRQRARIVQAMDHLAHGQPIAQVTAATAFASTAAFSRAFWQVTRTTPTAFADHRAPAFG